MSSPQAQLAARSSNARFARRQDMRSLLFLGYVPPVNTMPAVGERAVEQLAFPLEMFRCEDCGLAQIGLEVSPEVLFPYSYPYLQRHHAGFCATISPISIGKRRQKLRAAARRFRRSTSARMTARC